MPKPLTKPKDTFSWRLSLWVVTVVAILYVATLTVMFHFSRQAVRDEALAKAAVTLDETVLQIDLVFDQMEGATKCLHWMAEHHLDNPEAMRAFTQIVVKNDSAIAGCVIALEPDFMNRQQFLSYSFRKNIVNEQGIQEVKIVETDNYGIASYLHQEWYTETRDKNEACWIKLNEDLGTGQILAAYCMPLNDASGKVIGVVGIGISLDRFSQTILDTKPFPDSYCSMIDQEGNYIIHPDTVKLHRRTIYDLPGASQNTRMGILLKSMMASESGYKTVDIEGEECYVFYKTFNSEKWVATIICPEDELLPGNARLQKSGLALAVVGLLFLLPFCLLVVNKILKPLGLLAHTVKRLTQGHYDETIPETHRHDEIGALQNSFHAMQQSIEKHVNDIQQANDALKKSNEALLAANVQAQEADRIKDAFIRNMSDQLGQPVNIIESIVNDLHNGKQGMTKSETEELVKCMEKQTAVVTKILDQMLEVSQQKGGQP